MKSNLILLYLFSLLLYCCTTLSEITLKSETSIIERHLKKITKTSLPRNYKNTEVLDYTSDYIYSEFLNYCDTAYYQTYLVDNKEYRNVIGAFKGDNPKKVIVGAHYDVAGNQEGADDNASGVVGLLELARLLRSQKSNYSIELVAYTLEEPPFFKTKNMGSYMHAKSLAELKTPITGMICLEMIGYFSDKKSSQSYPLPHKTLIYGSKGDYIMLVQKMGKSQFCKQVKNLMEKADRIETKSIKAPKALPGIDFSDHLNYWDFEFDALMVTNTAFYRNKNYHQMTDTMEKLDLDKMGEVINSVFYTLINL